MDREAFFNDTAPLIVQWGEKLREEICQSRWQQSFPPKDGREYSTKIEETLRSLHELPTYNLEQGNLILGLLIVQLAKENIPAASERSLDIVFDALSYYTSVCAHESVNGLSSIPDPHRSDLYQLIVGLMADRLGLSEEEAAQQLQKVHNIFTAAESVHIAKPVEMPTTNIIGQIHAGMANDNIYELPVRGTYRLIRDRFLSHNPLYHKLCGQLTGYSVPKSDWGVLIGIPSNDEALEAATTELFKQVPRNDPMRSTLSYVQMLVFMATSYASLIENLKQGGANIDAMESVQHGRNDLVKVYMQATGADITAAKLEVQAFDSDVRAFGRTGIPR